MKYWFLSDIDRLAKEKKEIEKLQSKAIWLEETEWTLENGLTLIAKIKAHGNLYEVKLTYPSFFPHTPPTVTPRAKGTYWSNHQYEDGSLCLEWGPDNWVSSITGANLLESTYRLIYTENPLGNNKGKNLVISRHQLTKGQNLRNKTFRLYLESEFLSIISSLQDQYIGKLKYTFVFGNKSSATLHVLELEDEEKQVWKNTSLPEEFKSNYSLTGVVLRSNLSETEIHKMKAVTEWKKHDDLEIITSLSDTLLIIVIDKENNPHALMSDTNNEKLFPIPLISEKPKERLPNYLIDLKEKRIGIVGLGSLGSKISLSLARTGIREFYLVDDDIFLPGNLIRHTLDWESVGSHKVDAVKNQLMNISTSVNIAVSRINLSGQEATTSLNTVLSKLGNCDLIINATANPKVFNVLSAVGTTYKKPIVWGEIFAGGIGGLIARSRPEADPDPLTMREGFNKYTMQLPEFKFKVLDAYATEDQHEEIMLASDADVSIIAGHITRFALDTFLAPNQSMYPYSIYLIGLSNSWIFEAPFDTRPIHINPSLEEPKTIENTTELKEAVEFIISLIEENND